MANKSTDQVAGYHLPRNQFKKFFYPPSEHSCSISTNYFTLLECCSLKELAGVLFMKVSKLF